MTFQIVSRAPVSRRTILAVMPASVLAGATVRSVRAQPAPAEPVSFYLGQVLALATLQAQAVGRLRPLLMDPAPESAAWMAGSASEAGVIGAVASVLGAMEPPAELSASVGELRLAAAAYQAAADATGRASIGDGAALQSASVGLTEGATHILLWLDALTTETGNDWGDGLRTLAAAAISPAAVSTAANVAPVAASLPAAPADPGDG